jgi:hypothetical protein
MTNLFENGQADGRQADRTYLTDAELLFRPRYRQLGDDERDLHDRIKAKAAELAALFYEVEPINLGPSKVRERGANVQMGVRHLEDAVYRVVKALTGPKLMDPAVNGASVGRAPTYPSPPSPAPLTPEQIAAGRAKLDAEIEKLANELVDAAADDGRRADAGQVDNGQADNGEAGRVEDLEGKLKRGEPIEPKPEGEVKTDALASSAPAFDVEAKAMAEAAGLDWSRLPEDSRAQIRRLAELQGGARNGDVAGADGSGKDAPEKAEAEAAARPAESDGRGVAVNPGGPVIT